MLSFVTPLSPAQQSRLMALLSKTSASASASASASGSANASGSASASTSAGAGVITTATTATNASASVSANTTISTGDDTNTFSTAPTSVSEPHQPPLTLSMLMGQLGRAHVQANFTSKNTRQILITCLNNAMSRSQTSSLPLTSLIWLSLLTCWISYLWYKRFTS